MVAIITEAGGAASVFLHRLGGNDTKVMMQVIQNVMETMLRLYAGQAEKMRTIADGF